MVEAMADKRLTECWSFIKQVARGRWFSVFASFLIMIGAGATYMFGTYSKVIKTQFDYSQTQINTLGFAKDLGSNAGVVAGLLAEVVPTWMLFIIGSSLNFFSYFMVWLSVTSRVSKPQFWQMCVYISLAANSQNFANTAVLVTCVKNFPERRGIILGLLKGFVGIGGAILTQVYLSIYGNQNPANLILVLAWLPSTVSLVLLLSIRTIKAQKHPHELRIFYQLLYVSIVLALFLMVLTITQKHATFTRAAYLGGSVVIFGLLCLPLLIAIKEEFIIFELKKQSVGPTVSISIPEQKSPSKVTSNRLPSTLEEITETPPSCFSNVFNKPERGLDYTILQAILSKDMAILFVATLCGTGSTIAAIDNLGQIGESLGYPPQAISVFVSLVSILNFFGRVFSGFISEMLMIKYKFPRPLMFALFHLLTCIGELFIAYPSPGSVYLASLIIGFAFGAQVPLLFAIISELFGLKYYSTLFNFGQLAVPVGSYILNVDVIGYLYDLEAVKGGQMKTGKGLTCIGAHCFGAAFTILAGVTLFGAIISLVLAFRTREFYKGDIYERFKEDMWMPQTDMEFYCLNNKKESDKERKRRF